jgi:classical protein kinase C
MKDYFSEEAKDLITRLTTADLSKRLGCGKRGSQEIKDHPFFKTIDWVKLLRREIEPPYKPKLKHECDTSKIDTDFTNTAIKRTPTNERVTRQIEIDQFEEADIPDFQFVNPKVIANWKHSQKAQEKAIDKDFFS